jgi:hypothetical protein
VRQRDRENEGHKEKEESLKKLNSVMYEEKGCNDVVSLNGFVVQQ